jgi:hypothetical protein
MPQFLIKTKQVDQKDHPIGLCCQSYMLVRDHLSYILHQYRTIIEPHNQVKPYVHSQLLPNTQRAVQLSLLVDLIANLAAHFQNGPQ